MKNEKLVTERIRNRKRGEMKERTDRRRRKK
jgi:hypothetical protein